MSRRKTTSASDPIYAIAESTAAEIGAEFLNALVRVLRDAMDVSVAMITRGIGEPPVRARASFSWKKPGLDFPPDEYDIEGTPCRLVYQGQNIIVPEQLWRKFPIEVNKEGYCGVPLRDRTGKVVGHLFVLSDTPIANPERAQGIMRIFGMRVQAELQRIEAEQERAALIQRLSHTLERLDHQHRLTRQANAFKTDALGMVAHDLRSPLAAIVNRMELIGALIEKEAGRGKDASMAALREKLQTSCASIGRSADRMEQMIAGLLASARTEARAIALRCSDVDLADPVRVAIGMNHAAAEAKQLRITEMHGQAGRITADEDRLIEAIDNLLSNAVKYSPAGGAIVVETGIDPGAGLATVRVTDRGQGLSRDDIGLAFQRFQRLSAKPTAGESSTGLGLAIVKAIAEAHGGSVEVASAGQGQGSTFTLRLPVAGPGSSS